MTRTFRVASLVATFLGPIAYAGEPSTTLEATSLVPAEQDGCLDASVRELGMSAKRVDAERRWSIGPQYLHPSVKESGTLGVRFEKGARSTTVRVTATWPGSRKPREVQPELELRLMAMASKLSQICGVVKADVKCTVTEPGVASAPCTPGAR